MALKKSIETAEGISIEYHKIKTIFIDKDRDLCRVHMEIFTNQDARLSDKRPAEYASYDLSFSAVLINENTTLLSQIYSELKNLDFFKDALDV